MTSRRQFLATYAEGTRVGTPAFTLFARPNGGPTCRLGITVTRKYGHAVRRNRAKRVVRDIFRRNRARLEPPCDMVINVHPGFRHRSSADLERLFLDSFARVARRQP